MTILFGNQALKRSLGIPSLIELGSFRDRATAAISPPPAPPKDASISTSEFKAERPSTSTLEELLYEARAEAKIQTSRVARYIDDGWRRGLYRQLDSLLDIEEWFEGDDPLGTNSFSTFLRLMLVVRPEKRPGLGLTSDGNLIVNWQTGNARLTIECRGNDFIKCVLSHTVDDHRETAAVDTTVDRILEVLAPYNPERWFAHDDAQFT